MMMTIAIRFIPTLAEETDKIMKAQMARGADFETGNIIRRAKAMIPAFGTAFCKCVQTCRRACNGYGRQVLTTAAITVQNERNAYD